MDKSKIKLAVEFLNRVTNRMNKGFGIPESICPELILKSMKLGCFSIGDEDFQDYATELEIVAVSQLEEIRKEIMAGPIGEKLRECPFDLTGISLQLLERVAECWEERDIYGILFLMPSEDRLDFIWNNVRPLIDTGAYERALFNAYVGVNMNMIHSRFTRNDLLYLFKQGRRETLRECGNPLPHKGPFTVYRGVVDASIKESIRRIS